MKNKHRDSAINSVIGRRSMLKGSVVGGSLALAEGLLAGAFPGAALAAGDVPGEAQEANGAPAEGTPKHLEEIVPIKLEYVFQIRIDFKERVSFKTPNGRRAYVPAISGVIEGPRLQGKVVPHSGADYAGNGRLNAHYMLQASDGTMIYINNMGISIRRTASRSTNRIRPGAETASFTSAARLCLTRPSARMTG